MCVTKICVVSTQWFGLQDPNLKCPSILNDEAVSSVYLPCLCKMTKDVFGTAIKSTRVGRIMTFLYHSSHWWLLACVTALEGWQFWVMTKNEIIYKTFEKYLVCKT